MNKLSPASITQDRRQACEDRVYSQHVEIGVNEAIVFNFYGNCVGLNVHLCQVIQFGFLKMKAVILMSHSNKVVGHLPTAYTRKKQGEG